MTCGECGGAGWVLDAKLDKEPTTLELMPCIVPDCTASGREVAVLCLYGEWGAPVFHPTTLGVMSVSRMPPDRRHFRRITVEDDRETAHAQVCETLPPHSWRDCPNYDFDDEGMYRR